MNMLKFLWVRLKKRVKRFHLIYSLYRKAKDRITRIARGRFMFPTHVYAFTHNDAKKIYSIVISGKLHHHIGNEVKSLEKEFSAYHKTTYSVATNSGTSALEMALKAIRIMPGDEVIVPAYTFVATAQAVVNRGGIPVFADIDDTFTIDPSTIEACITPRTKAIIPVHLFGNVADMDRVMHIAKKYKLRVVEDACQAVGAAAHNRRVGSIGHIGCFSFDIGKAITTGQGGMFITSDRTYYDIAYTTRDTGQIDDVKGSDVITTGNTYALTEMQGALARTILFQLDELNTRRKHNYEHFVSVIETSRAPLRWYRILPYVTPSFSRLVFMVDFSRLSTSRAHMLQYFHARGLPVRTFYPVPLYRYSLFKKRRDVMTGSTYPFSMGRKKKQQTCSFAEKFCDQQVGLEFSPYLQPNHIRHLSHTLKEYFSSYKK